jgi:hypothetical protein
VTDDRVATPRTACVLHHRACAGCTDWLCGLVPL